MRRMRQKNATTKMAMMMSALDVLSIINMISSQILQQKLLKSLRKFDPKNMKLSEHAYTPIHLLHIYLQAKDAKTLSFSARDALHLLLAQATAQSTQLTLGNLKSIVLIACASIISTKQSELFFRNNLMSSLAQLMSSISQQGILTVKQRIQLIRTSLSLLKENSKFPSEIDFYKDCQTINFFSPKITPKNASLSADFYIQTIKAFKVDLVNLLNSQLKASLFDSPFKNSLQLLESDIDRASAWNEWTSSVDKNEFSQQDINYFPKFIRMASSSVLNFILQNISSLKPSMCATFLVLGVVQASRPHPRVLKQLQQKVQQWSGQQGQLCLNLLTLMKQRRTIQRLEGISQQIGRCKSKQKVLSLSFRVRAFFGRTTLNLQNYSQFTQEVPLLRDRIEPLNFIEQFEVFKAIVRSLVNAKPLFQDERYDRWAKEIQLYYKALKQAKIYDLNLFHPKLQDIQFDSALRLLQTDHSLQIRTYALLKIYESISQQSLAQTQISSLGRRLEQIYKQLNYKSTSVEKVLQADTIAYEFIVQNESHHKLIHFNMICGKGVGLLAELILKIGLRTNLSWAILNSHSSVYHPSRFNLTFHQFFQQFQALTEQQVETFLSQQVRGINSKRAQFIRQLLVLTLKDKLTVLLNKSKASLLLANLCLDLIWKLVTLAMDQFLNQLLLQNLKDIVYLQMMTKDRTCVLLYAKILDKVSKKKRGSVYQRMLIAILEVISQNRNQTFLSNLPFVNLFLIDRKVQNLVALQSHYQIFITQLKTADLKFMGGSLMAKLILQLQIIFSDNKYKQTHRQTRFKRISKIFDKQILKNCQRQISFTCIDCNKHFCGVCVGYHQHKLFNKPVQTGICQNSRQFSLGTRQRQGRVSKLGSTTNNQNLNFSSLKQYQPNPTLLDFMKTHLDQVCQFQEKQLNREVAQYLSREKSMTFQRGTNRSDLSLKRNNTISDFQEIYRRDCCMATNHVSLLAMSEGRQLFICDLQNFIKFHTAASDFQRFNKPKQKFSVDILQLSFSAVALNQLAVVLANSLQVFAVDFLTGLQLLFRLNQKIQKIKWHPTQQGQFFVLSAGTIKQYKVTFRNHKILHSFTCGESIVNMLPISLVDQFYLIVVDQRSCLSYFQSQKDKGQPHPLWNLPFLNTKPISCLTYSQPHKTIFLAVNYNIVFVLRLNKDMTVGESQRIHCIQKIQQITRPIYISDISFRNHTIPQMTLTLCHQREKKYTFVSLYFCQHTVRVWVNPFKLLGGFFFVKDEPKTIRGILGLLNGLQAVFFQQTSEQSNCRKSSTVGQLQFVKAILYVSSLKAQIGSVELSPFVSKERSSGESVSIQGKSVEIYHSRELNSIMGRAVIKTREKSQASILLLNQFQALQDFVSGFTFVQMDSHVESVQFYSSDYRNLSSLVNCINFGGDFLDAFTGQVNNYLINDQEISQVVNIPISSYLNMQFDYRSVMFFQQIQVIFRTLYYLFRGDRPFIRNQLPPLVTLLRVYPNPLVQRRAKLTTEVFFIINTDMLGQQAFLQKKLTADCVDLLKKLQIRTDITSNLTAFYLNFVQNFHNDIRMLANSLYAVPLLMQAVLKGLIKDSHLSNPNEYLRKMFFSIIYVQDHYLNSQIQLQDEIIKDSLIVIYNLLREGRDSPASHQFQSIFSEFQINSKHSLCMKLIRTFLQHNFQEQLIEFTAIRKHAIFLSLSIKVLRPFHLGQLIDLVSNCRSISFNSYLMTVVALISVNTQNVKKEEEQVGLSKLIRRVRQLLELKEKPNNALKKKQLMEILFLKQQNLKQSVFDSLQDNLGIFVLKSFTRMMVDLSRHLRLSSEQKIQLIKVVALGLYSYSYAKVMQLLLFYQPQTDKQIKFEMFQYLIQNLDKREKFVQYLLGCVLDNTPLWRQFCSLKSSLILTIPLDTPAKLRLYRLIEQ